MKKIQRLKDMQSLWESKYRHDYHSGDLYWNDIQWDPFSLKGEPIDPSIVLFPNVLEQIKQAGRFFYLWSNYEEASGSIEWDWSLLRCLFSWYSLPEDCDAPFMVNEPGMAICIPDLQWVGSFSTLFSNQYSVRLGATTVPASPLTIEGYRRPTVGQEVSLRLRV